MNSSLINNQITPGRYILAVSGGVDSITLLDLLAGRPGIELVVAHFNHGIREDAREDEKLVERAAQDHGLKFEVGYGTLGPAASEDQARRARYGFLRQIKKQYGCKAIITAHHQDDLIETAIINLLRGSGRKGLTAMADNPEVLRPLLNVPKKKIIAYALAHKLNWRNDSTNKDPKYLRNYIRLRVIPKLSAAQRQQLVKNIEKVAKIKPELDNLLATLSHSVGKNDFIDRGKFSALPLELTNELMVYWLRQHGLLQFDQKTVERLNLGLRTARPNTELVVNKDWRLVIAATGAHFSNR